ncbi:hypothetical protein RFI_03129 [Reticulomyxa filosa]|uniref:Uncharacterized protein n=1 Tax=Reticulomyxa filosa TaxID=46433 RepID=X6P6Z7_RETFI|nr:hypothetical protein RFI_03129 [Reticulomyxa filosa]|eukprot:ETO33966.1 hypothetical protein RFI_03129 [Reticulomyxa filosa]
MYFSVTFRSFDFTEKFDAFFFFFFEVEKKKNFNAIFTRGQTEDLHMMELSFFLKVLMCQNVNLKKNANAEKKRIFFEREIKKHNFPFFTDKYMSLEFFFPFIAYTTKRCHSNRLFDQKWLAKLKWIGSISSGMHKT